MQLVDFLCHEDQFGHPPAKVGLVFGNNMTTVKSDYCLALAKQLGLKLIGAYRDYNKNPYFGPDHYERAQAVLKELYRTNINGEMSLSQFTRDDLVCPNTPLSSGMGLRGLLPIIDALLQMKTTGVGLYISCPEYCLNPKIQLSLMDCILFHATYKTPVVLSTHAECFDMRVSRRIREGKLSSGAVTVRAFDEHGTLDFYPYDHDGDRAIKPLPGCLGSDVRVKEIFGD